MRLFILLVVIGLSALIGSGFTPLRETDCTSILATAITKSPTAGLENGEITVQAKGKGKLHYFFFNNKGYPINSTKEELNYVKNLREGTYKCSVVDETGCIKQLVIELN